MRLLLVDDHAVVRKGIKAILEDDLPGVQVIEAGNGDQALALLAEPFDAVVLDLSMPGRSGIDLLAEIKQSDLEEQKKKMAEQRSRRRVARDW